MPRLKSLPAYSGAQNEYLRLHYSAAPQAAIQAQFPGRHWKMVQKQASRLQCGQRCPGRTSVSKDWPLRFTDFLRANYPEFGALPVAAFTGLSVVVVRSRAHYLGISFRHRANVPKLPPGPRPPRKAAAPRAPRVVAAKPDKATPLLAVKRSALTPNLNVAKEARKRREQPRTGLADAIARHKTLPYGCSEHTAFLRDGLAGWQQWQTEQAA